MLPWVHPAALMIQFIGTFTLAAALVLTALTLWCQHWTRNWLSSVHKFSFVWKIVSLLWQYIVLCHVLDFLSIPFTHLGIVSLLQTVRSENDYPMYISFPFVWEIFATVTTIVSCHEHAFDWYCLIWDSFVNFIYSANNHVHRLSLCKHTTTPRCMLQIT